MKCPDCGLGDLGDYDDPKDPGAALASCYPRRPSGTSCGAIFSVRLEIEGYRAVRKPEVGRHG
jgi:hypothetical protein